MKRLWILLILTLAIMTSCSGAEEREYIGCTEIDSWYCDMGVGGCGTEGSAVVYYDEYSHWWLCSECGEEYALPHEYASCIAKDTCLTCGAQGVCCQNIMCDRENPIYKWDEEFHWEACPDCGEPLDMDDLIWKHSATCDAPNACVDCGAQDIVAEEVYHADEYVMQHDEYYHWETCAGCGEQMDYVYGHRSYCNTPTTCMECEATNIVPQEIEHDYDTDAHDDTHCWWECVLCGDVYSKGVHKASCRRPNECIYCDQTDVTIAEFYNHDEQYLDTEYRPISDTQCQLCCEDCGMGLAEPVQHVVYCWSKEKCYRCGYAACVDAKIDGHDDRGEYIVISDTQHQLVCGACREPIEEPSRHWSFCSGEQSSWCYLCSYGPVVNPNVAHEMTDDEMGYDATRHWDKCSSCGEPVEGQDDGTIYFPHVAKCDEPDTCVECGATGITAETIEHAGSWEWTYNDTKHFYECSACGAQKADKYYIEEHFSTCDAPTVCWNCSYVGPNCKVLHAYTNFDDGFISFEGALLSNENGHWRVCPGCGDKTPQPHTFGSNNLCTECGYEKKTTTRLPGDADNSTGITLADAVVVLQYCASKTTSINTSNADVTGDGEVDAKDALRILQHEAGWNVTLK